MSDLAPLDQAVLPSGIRSRFVDDVNGLRVHILEAGFEQPGRPCVLLLHGFPELAWSWRRVMGPLAAAGYHVVAPDLRGYGRTTGWGADYDSEADLRSFRLLNAVRDALGLVVTLGHRSVAAVVGHDFGSPVAAWCALVRPDVFRSVALMSAPFAGPPALPRPPPGPDIHDALAKLARPRKHYQWYYSTRPANGDMWHCPQGVHDFLRAYYHHKSADWEENRPFRLKGWTAEELAKMPTYYVMDLDETMAETVAHMMPSSAAIAACRWLPDSELAVYSAEYERTGFQGGLQWYRRGTGGRIPPNWSCSRAGRSTCPRSSSREAATGGSISGPAPSSGCRRARARGCWAVTCSTAQGTGCSRSSGSKVSELLVEFLGRQKSRAA